jgi:hypothetical protein
MFHTKFDIHIHLVCAYYEMKDMTPGYILMLRKNMKSPFFKYFSAFPFIAMV